MKIPADQLETDVPVTIGTSNALGTSSAVALSDHVHAHGSQSDGSLHAVATSGAAGFMSAADRVKLDGIAAGATANTLALTNSAPQPISTGSTVGTGTAAARSDHVHSHGAQTDGTLHAAATQSVAGFLSSADKTKLDGIASGATNTPLASTTPAAVAVAGAVGVGTTAARADHAHAHGAQTDGTLHAVATTSVAGFLSAADKTKLDGIATGATSLQLASTTPATLGAAAVGTGTTAARSDHVHDHGNQAGGALHAVATQSVAGFLSASDKTKLDGIATGATALALASTTPAAVGTSGAVGTGTNAAREDHVHALPVATQSTSGQLSAADKTKLDGVASSATNTPLASAAPAAVGTAAVVGVGTSAARGDHVHAHGTQSDGTHHAVATQSVAGFLSAADKTKLDGIASGATALALTSATPAAVGTSAATGTGTNAAREDHVHALPIATQTTSGQLSAADKTKLDGVATGATNTPLSSAGPAAVAVAASVGVSTSAARGDHVHAHGAQTDGTLHAVATQSVAGFLSAADKTKLDGIATGATALSLSSTSPADVGTTAVGVGTTAARADHVHAHGNQAGGGLHALATGSVAGFLSSSDYTKLQGIASAAAAVGSTAASTVSDATAAAGSAATAARSDHVHAVSIGTPVAITTTNAAGVATSLARSDHTHSHGAQTDGTHHAVVTTSVAGFMSSADKTKLDGIASGADVTLTALSTAVAAIAVNNQRITSAADPINPQDLATKAYTDALFQGLDVKASVRVATTVNIANLISAAPNVVDGKTLASNDRVLVKNQTTASQNGIYRVVTVGTGSNGSWARDSDANTSAKVTAGLYTWVTEGSVNADSGWILVTDDAITLDTTALTFTQFSGAGQIGDGAGLTKSGNTLNVGANADGSIVVNADDVQVGVLATDMQHGSRGGGSTHAVATQSVAGFLSAADKTKLDGIASAAAAVGSVTPTTVAYIASAAGSNALAARADHSHQAVIGTPVAIGTANSSSAAGGTTTSLALSDHVHAHGSQTDGTLHAVATTSVAGFLSSSDKTKLDGIASGATATPFSATAPSDIGTTAVGTTATGAARGDHVHAHGNQVGGTLHAVVVAAGTAGFMSGADKTKLDGIASGATNTALAATGGVTADLGTSNSGTATTAARSDHVHAHGNLAGGSLHAVVVAAGASGFMSGADKTKLDGIASGADATIATLAAASAAISVNSQRIISLLDPVSAQDAATKNSSETFATAAANTAVSNLALTDAQHGQRGSGTTASPLHAVATQTAPGFLSAADKLKLDGIASGATNTPLTSTAPSSVGTANGVGTTTNGAARWDHVHAHGAQSDTTLHAVAIGGGSPAHGFMSSTDKVKLDTIASYADFTDYVVRVYAASNITLSGAQIIDGVTVASGDLVFCLSQSPSGNNGIWVVNGSGAWSRPANAAVNRVWGPGVSVCIAEGAIYARTRFTAINTNNQSAAYTALIGQASGLSLSSLTWAISPYSDPGSVPFAHVYADSNQSLTGAATIDGRTMATGERVLCGAQTITTNNGIWIVNTAGAWTRAPESAAGMLWRPGTLVYVVAGTTYIGQYMRLVATGIVTIGTTTGTSFVRTLPLDALGEPASFLAASTSTAGNAQMFARSDHVHGHGCVGGYQHPTYGGLHALASNVPGSQWDGFMSMADKLKLDYSVPFLWARVYADANITLTLAATPTLDGKSLAAGDRVLVGNQTSAADNGLYVVTASGTWGRAPEAPAGTKLSPGQRIFVYSGDKYYFQEFAVNTAAPVTLGTTTGWAFYKSMSNPNNYTGNDGSVVLQDNEQSSGGVSGQYAWFARADHQHPHGALSNQYLHAVATQSANGFMSSTDKAKLDGVVIAGIKYVTIETAVTNQLVQVDPGLRLIGAWLRPGAGGGGAGGSGGKGASVNVAGGGGGGGGMAGGSATSTFVPVFASYVGDIYVTVGAGGTAGVAAAAAAGGNGGQGGASRITINGTVIADTGPGGAGGAGGGLGGTASGTTGGTAGVAGVSGQRWPATHTSLWPVAGAGGAGGGSSAAGSAGGINVLGSGPSGFPGSMTVNTAAGGGAANGTRSGGGGGGAGASAGPGDETGTPADSTPPSNAVGKGGAGGAGAAGVATGTGNTGTVGSAATNGSQGRGGGGGGGGGAGSGSVTGQSSGGTGGGGGVGSVGCVVLMFSDEVGDLV